MKAIADFKSWPGLTLYDYVLFRVLTQITSVVILVITS